MQFYGALVLFVTLSAACGLSCYVCTGKTCSDKMTCPATYDRCATATVNNAVTKSCQNFAACVSPIKCCSKDLCNSAMPSASSGYVAIPTGSSVLLLLVSSAILTLFH